MWLKSIKHIVFVLTSINYVSTIYTYYHYSASIHSTNKLRLDKKHNHFNQTKSSENFLLKCPRPSFEKWKNKTNFSVDWSWNNVPFVSIKKSMTDSLLRIESNFSINVKQWRTIKEGSINAIVQAKNQRYKFEFEEDRIWLAFRIHKLKIAVDHGQWKCHMQICTVDNKCNQLESRKRVSKKQRRGGEKLPTVETHKPRRKTRMNYKEDFDYIESLRDGEVPNETGKGQPLFVFAKDGGESAIFRRRKEFGEISFTRKDDFIEYSRGESHGTAVPEHNYENKKGIDYTTWNIFSDACLISPCSNIMMELVIVTIVFMINH